MRTELNKIGKQELFLMHVGDTYSTFFKEKKAARSIARYAYTIAKQREDIERFACNIEEYCGVFRLSITAL